jgi:hypothetical protein
MALMSTATPPTKTGIRTDERPAQPLEREGYSPPAFAWEQEFVALAQISFSGPPGGDCDNNPNPGCW